MLSKNRRITVIVSLLFFSTFKSNGQTAGNFGEGILVIKEYLVPYTQWKDFKIKGELSTIYSYEIKGNKILRLEYKADDKTVYQNGQKINVNYSTSPFLIDGDTKMAYNLSGKKGLAIVKKGPIQKLWPDFFYSNILCTPPPKLKIVKTGKHLFPVDDFLSKDQQGMAITPEGDTTFFTFRNGRLPVPSPINFYFSQFKNDLTSISILLAPGKDPNKRQRIVFVVEQSVARKLPASKFAIPAS